MNTLQLIGRTKPLFEQDVKSHAQKLHDVVGASSFLVLGGAGSIGKAVVKEIFLRNPKRLHVVDISENNLAELVRDIRSSYGYIDGEFQTFVLDIGSTIFDTFMSQSKGYDYVLNLSALKHVRSEKDAFTLMRMLQVNVLNTVKTAQQAKEKGAKKYFCVSTDKAANPVNLMGGSKRMMEIFLQHYGKSIEKSFARFANVAFSDGSLLHSFEQRIKLHQPIVAPSDVKRYFITPKESGILCLLSCIFGKDAEIFFPKLDASTHLISFQDIAVRYLQEKGWSPHICASEDEARNCSTSELMQQGKYPCFFTISDTTGEKSFEEFYTDTEKVIFNRFEELGIVALHDKQLSSEKIEAENKKLQQLLSSGKWTKEDIVEIIAAIVPELKYTDKFKYLDAKM